MYGSNTAIMVLAVVAVVALADWLSVKFNYSRDCTTGGIYSLSPRTHDLLRQIDRSGKTYSLVSLFPTSLAADPAERTDGLKVRQLMKEYAQASHRVKIFRPHSRHALLVQLRGRFGDQFQPYRKALRQFDPLARSLLAFFKTRAKGIRALSGQATVARNRRELAHYIVLSSVFSDYLPRLLRRTRRRVARQIKSTLPDWPGLVRRITGALRNIQDNLQRISEKKIRAEFGPTVQAWLKKNTAAIKKRAAALTAYINTLTLLKPVKSSRVLRNLSPDSLVLMGPHNAKVLTRNELFLPRKGVRGRIHYLFEGEQAVNAALLAMTQKHPPKVVFVSLDPQNMISRGGPFSHAVRILRRNNFKVFQWSPTPPNPQAPAANTTPPAIGKGVIWVVLDLPPSGQQAMLALMQYQQLETEIKKQLSDGGNAMFLLGAMPAQLLMTTQGHIPFKSMLASYGIRLRSTYSVVQRMQVHPGVHVLIPQFAVSTYPKTTIGKPIESLRTIFTSYEGSPLLAPTVIEPLASTPKNTVAQVLVRTANSANIWGTTQPQATRAGFAPGDLKSPLPIAVMAQKLATRVVAIGDPLFIANGVINEGYLSLAGGQPVVISDFPGNAELFLNSMYWLAHESHLIAVSPRATVALRIRKLSSGAEMFVRLASFVGPATFAVLGGLVVFLVRRRI